MSQDAANVEEFNLDDVLLGASSGDSDWFPDDGSGSETDDDSGCETNAASGCETEASRFSDEEECQIKEVQDVILPNMEEPKMTPRTKYNSVEEFRYKLAYGNSINPITEKDEWEKVDVNKVKPPLVNRQPGRPQNARRKGKDEVGGPARAKRVHVCKNCGVHRHQARTCTDPGHLASTCTDPIKPTGRPKNTNTVTRARNPTNRMVLLSDGTTIREPSRRAIPDVLRDTPDIVTQESRNSILTYVRRRRKVT